MTIKLHAKHFFMNGAIFDIKTCNTFIFSHCNLACYVFMIKYAIFVQSIDRSRICFEEECLNRGVTKINDAWGRPNFAVAPLKLLVVK